jgi:hypothetical protein
MVKKSRVKKSEGRKRIFPTLPLSHCSTLPLSHSHPLPTENSKLTHGQVFVSTKSLVRVEEF